MSPVGSGPSLLDRLLGAALTLLLAAIALVVAVHLLASILWPLLGLSAAALLSVGVWQLWRSRHGGW